MWYRVLIGQDNISLKRPFKFSLEKGDTRDILISGEYYDDKYEMAKHSYETDKVSQMIRVGGKNILFLTCNIKDRMTKNEIEKINAIRNNDALEEFEQTNEPIIKTWRKIVDIGKALDFIKNDYKELVNMCPLPVETIIISAMDGSEADRLLKERFAKLGELYGAGVDATFNFYTKVI